MINANKRISRYMGLNLLMIAFAFYFLPDFTVFDLLPDVMAYVLITLGLSKLSDVSESIADARRKFSYMIYYGIGKLASLFVIFGLIGYDERPNAFLVAAFAFSVVEIFFLIPAYKSLFDGILYLGMREESVAVFKQEEKKQTNASYTEKVKRFTVIFIVVKNLAATLPESLSLLVNVDVQSYNHSFYDDINYFRFIAMTLSLVFGIIWLKKIEKYFSAIVNDRPFMARVCEKYEKEVLPNTALFTRRRIKKAILLLVIGAFLTVDFYIEGNDGFNVLPDILGALCFIGGILFTFEGKNRYKVPTIIVTALYGVLSTLTWIFNYMFTYEYTAAEVSRDVTANALWTVLFAVSVLEAVGFFAMVGSAALAVRELVREHTGSVNAYASIDPEAKKKALHREFEKRLYVCLFFVALAAASGPFRVWMFSSESMVADMSWIFEFVLTITFACVFTRTLHLVNEEVEEKYRLM